MSFKLTTTVTAVHKCIYPGSQWSSLVWDPQREQVIIVLLKQSPFWYVTGEDEAWAERGEQGEVVGRTNSRPQSVDVKVV